MYKNDYGMVKVESDIPLYNIENVRIKESINQHFEAWFIAVIHSMDVKTAVDTIGLETNIKIKFITQKEEQILFEGIVDNFQITFKSSTYKIEYHLISHSYLLDIKKKKRSFQDNYTYYEILSKIIKEEHKGDLLQTEEKDKTQTAPYIQYEETDWQFIKRIASELNMPVVLCMGNNKPQLFIGIPERKIVNIDTYEFQMKNKFGEYLISSNVNPCHELDFIEYIVINQMNLQLGDRIQFQNTVFLIVEKNISWKNEILQYEYHLKKETGTKPQKIQNNQLTGAILEGTITEIKKDKAKVHLSIDEEQDKSKAHWFPIATPYANTGKGGFCCMPDTEDQVRMYFPNHNMKNAYIDNVIRQDGETNDKTADNSICCFENTEGKELKFDSDGITVSGAEGITISMSVTEGININSTEDIQISSDKTIDLCGSCIEIKASDRIEIVTQFSNIIVDETIHLKGIEGVWDNGKPAK